MCRLVDANTTSFQATYIISQGNFTNPLTREPLAYSDCVMLDEYLEDHIYNYKNRDMQPVSVKEAWLLRDSIKVKVGDSSSRSERLRAESLRNEAAVAFEVYLCLVIGTNRRGRTSAQKILPMGMRLLAPRGASTLVTTSLAHRFLNKTG